MHAPERKTRLRRLTLPETMTAAGAVRVTDAEIDDNGHMNNVAYVRRAQEAAPGLFRGLEVVYDRECFRGALLTLEHAADADAQYVRGVLESGEESFRMRFCACCSCAPAPRRSRRTPCRRSWSAAGSAPETAISSRP